MPDQFSRSTPKANRLAFGCFWLGATLALLRTAALQGGYVSHQQIYNYASAAAAFTAAVLWMTASIIEVKADYSGAWPTKEDGTPVPYLTFYGGRGPIERKAKGALIDVTATLARQGRLNAFAAAAAAVAALLQGFALTLPSS